MPQGCDINKRQNSERLLDLLAAGSFFYRRAKFFLGLQFALTVPAAVVLAIIILKVPEAKGWTTFYALSIALLDTLVLDKVQSHYKRLGARTQELFDSELLELEWNMFRAGTRPDSEDLLQAASKFKKRSEMDRLRDWYPPAVRELPLPLARLVCQRANTWWDASLRKKYAIALIAILVLSIASVFMVSLLAGHTVEEMVLSVYAPIAPAVLWSFREIGRQHKAAKALDQLRVNVEQLWSTSLSGNLDRANLDIKSRQIQDSIFDGRVGNPLIFDWINRLVRPTQQVSMHAKAGELVAEARKSKAFAVL